MLRVQSVSVRYGRIQALKSVSLHVRPREIAALIGSNGAGKTTLINTISGLIKPVSGRIALDDRDLTKAGAPAVVRRGMVQVPEGRQLFGPLTVTENLELGAYHRFGRHQRADIQEEIDKIFEMFPVLGQRRRQPAGTLSGGEQQMLAIGRGMMAAPKCLLLDEPSLGLAPMVVSEIFAFIKKLQTQGVTILLVEQNARAALKASDRAYVLELGRVTLSGPSHELLDDREVKRAFLGKDYRDMREI
jgi:branched-chain amino acid transport system ATP-binding protein